MAKWLFLLAVLAVAMMTLVFSVDAMCHTAFLTCFHSMTGMVLEVIFIALLRFEVSMTQSTGMPLYKWAVISAFALLATALACMTSQIGVTHLTLFAKVGSF